MTLKAFWIVILTNLSMLNPTESNKTELQNALSLEKATKVQFDQLSNYRLFYTFAIKDLMTLLMRFCEDYSTHTYTLRSN